MAGSASSPSRDEVAKLIGDLAREEFDRAKRPMAGALLAQRIREKFPQLDPSVFGEHWLAELTRLAESQGTVVRNRNVKHLELTPAGESVRAVGGDLVAVRSDERRYVQPDVWRAFVFVAQTGPQYFDRNLHRVVSARSVSGGSEPNFIPITPIPAQEQQAWMRDFVNSRSLPTQDAPIQVDHWWGAFPQWLQRLAPQLEIEWRAFRSAQVVARIRAWARDNSISEDSILSPVARFAQRTAAQIPSADSRRPTVAHQRAARTALLLAINEMSLEELQTLSIPVRHILRHFIPR